MADTEKPRVVSGEFKAGPPDVIDADYISLPGQPAAAAASFGRGPRASEAIGSAAAPAAGMDVLREKREQARRGEPAGPLFWAFGALLVLAAFWIAGGHALFRDLNFPGAPAEENLRIVNVTSRVDSSGAKAVLLVDGETLNGGEAVEHLPPIEIAVTGNDGLVTRYRLGTSGRPLSPGETFGFSSRVDAPKNGVKTVTVTFVK